ncbi:MAG: M14-type cytosolic carboxypeptidase [Planctomycetota bacterium]
MSNHPKKRRPDVGLGALKSLLAGLKAALTATLLALLSTTASAQTFDGSFESGNLQSVSSLGPDRYAVTLRPDSSSTQRQWFYFSVRGAAGRTLTFELTPFDIASPWASGMTPCVTRDPDDPAAWGRVPAAQTAWSAGRLTFAYTFADDAPVWFAYSFAYTATRAAALVSEIEGSPFATRRTIGHSLQGRALEVLEVTEGPRNDKVGVWVQARQHPAECGSSWTCEAFLRWLIGDSASARALREHAVVQVLPMVNPDGVALGNYRTNFAGLDLNRQWNVASLAVSPEVYLVQQELAALEATHGLELFLDLHTHSSELKNWVFGESGSAQFDQRERGYAQAIEAEFSDFSFALSSFANGTTGAVAKTRVHQLYPDALTYTQEQTYHTLTYGPNVGAPITVARYEEMGVALGEAFVTFNAWSPSWETYCAPKVNSLGCTAGLFASGAPTFSGPDDFTVHATNVLSNSLGIYFWGAAPESSPLLGGLLCVRPPLIRTTAAMSGGSGPGLDCSGAYAFHWSQAKFFGAGLFPGARVHGQFWARDAMHPDGTGVSLTAGIAFTVQP